MPDEYAAGLKVVQRELSRLESGGGCVHLDLSPAEAFGVVANLQLACRHPGNLGEARTVAERVGRLIQAALARHSAELGRIVEQGWHEVFDVPRSPPG